MGEPLLEVETDKAVLTVESAYSGTLLKILYPADETLEVGHRHRLRRPARRVARRVERWCCAPCHYSRQQRRKWRTCPYAGGRASTRRGAEWWPRAGLAGGAADGA